MNGLTPEVVAKLLAVGTILDNQPVPLEGRTTVPSLTVEDFVKVGKP